VSDFAAIKVLEEDFLVDAGQAIRPIPEIGDAV
jgi:hypothetical protein